MAIDAIGYPYVLEITSPEGKRDMVFANEAGRIASKPGQYVANRQDANMGCTSGAS